MDWTHFKDWWRLKKWRKYRRASDVDAESSDSLCYCDECFNDYVNISFLTVCNFYTTSFVCIKSINY